MVPSQQSLPVREISECEAAACWAHVGCPAPPAMSLLHQQRHMGSGGYFSPHFITCSPAAPLGQLVQGHSYSLLRDGCVNAGLGTGRFHCNSALFKNQTFPPSSPLSYRPQPFATSARRDFPAVLPLALSIAIFTKLLFFTY